MQTGQVRSVFSSIEHRVPFYTVHKSNAWMVVHVWSDGTTNSAQVQVRNADGPYCPIIWGKPW